MSVHDGAAAAIQLAAGFAAMLGCALPLCVAPGVRAARKRLSGRVAAERPVSVHRLPEPPVRRPTPSWARADVDAPDARNRSEAA